ncbi:hypothetical protein ACJX0J_034926 [Zea mays]
MYMLIVVASGLCITEVSLALFAAILDWLGRYLYKKTNTSMVNLNFGLPCILFAHLQNMIILIYSYILNINLSSVIYSVLGLLASCMILSLCFLISSVRINSSFLPTQYAQSRFFLTGFSWQGMYIML